MTNLEFIRRSRKLSQRALGIIAKVDASFICTAERYHFAHGSRLERLADALGWEGEPSGLLEEAPEVVA